MLCQSHLGIQSSVFWAVVAQYPLLYKEREHPAVTHQAGPQNSHSPTDSSINFPCEEQ